MILLAIAGSAIGEWLRRAILLLRQPELHSNRDVTPEFYKFPFV
jgi:hypothetical protein